MLRYFFVAFILIVIGVVTLAGFRGSKMTHPPIEIFNDMDHQPKFNPQHSSDFWADGRAARKPIPGTVPIGYTLKNSYYSTHANNVSENAQFTNQPDYYNTGIMGEVYGDGIPVEITEALLKRGQQRFEIGDGHNLLAVRVDHRHMMLRIAGGKRANWRDINVPNAM